MKARYADKVVIVTQTRYTGSRVEAVRAELAKSMVEKATNLGYQVVIMDSGSSEEVKKSLKREGVILVEGKQKGTKFGAARRRGFQIAYDLGKDVIVWIEPEKDELISKLEEVVKPIIKREVDLVVVERKSLDSYPEYQRKLEIRGNSFFKNLTGRDFDVLFAPRAFNRGAARFFIDYNGEYGDLWEGLFVPILDVIHNGKKVVGIKIDYKYPEEQARVEKNDSELHKKRQRQYEVITSSLKAHAEKLGII